MLVAIDVGNSNTNIGVFEQGELRCQMSTSTKRDWTRDQIAIELLQLLQLHQLNAESITQAAIACVVPPALSPLCAALEVHFGVQPFVVGPGVRTGLPVRYDPPQGVGADRIVASVAAYMRYRDDNEPNRHGFIMVDFGTATTFDVVSPKPEYIGGVIAPGVGISSDALFTRAARLPRVEIVTPPTVVGNNTIGAIQSGLVYGYIGLVEGIVRRIQAEVQWPTKVIATGGFAKQIIEQADCIDFIDADLMLHGLQLIFARNHPQSS